MTYGIMAYRTGMSQFGAASAWCKNEGQVMTFGTREEAEDKANEYNKDTGTANVYYRAKKMYD